MKSDLGEYFTGVKKEYYSFVAGDLVLEGDLLWKETTYVIGVEHGASKTYYPSGKLWTESNYVEGELDGWFIGYYENGNKKFEEHYTAGKLDGLYKAYHEDGSIAYTRNYDKVSPTKAS